MVKKLMFISALLSVSLVKQFNTTPEAADHSFAMAGSWAGYYTHKQMLEQEAVYKEGIAKLKEEYEQRIDEIQASQSMLQTHKAQLEEENSILQLGTKEQNDILDRINSQIKEKDATIKNLNSALDSKQQEHDSEHQERLNAEHNLGQEQYKFLNEKARLENERDQLAEDLLAKENHIAETMSRLQSVEKNLQQQKEDVAKLNSEKEALTKAQKTLEDKAAQVKEENQENTKKLKQKIDTLTSDKAALEKQKRELASKMDALNSKKEAIEKAKKMVDDKIVQIKEENQENTKKLKQKIDTLTSDKAALAKEKDEITAKAEALEAEKEALTKAQTTLEDKAAQIKEENQENTKKLKQKIDTLTSDKAALEKEKDEITAKAEALEAEKEALTKAQTTLEDKAAQIEKENEERSKELQKQIDALTSEKAAADKERDEIIKDISKPIETLCKERDDAKNELYELYGKFHDPDNQPKIREILTKMLDGTDPIATKLWTGGPDKGRGIGVENYVFFFWNMTLHGKSITREEKIDWILSWTKGDRNKQINIISLLQQRKECCETYIAKANFDLITTGLNYAECKSDTDKIIAFINKAIADLKSLKRQKGQLPVEKETIENIRKERDNSKNELYRLYGKFHDPKNEVKIKEILTKMLNDIHPIREKLWNLGGTGKSRGIGVEMNNFFARNISLNGKAQTKEEKIDWILSLTKGDHNKHSNIISILVENRILASNYIYKTNFDLVTTDLDHAQCKADTDKMIDFINKAITDLYAL